MPVYETGKVILEGLPHGSDLLETITDLARREGIKIGTVSAIGAVQRARIGYYDQESRRYRESVIEKRMEILSCLGNISCKADEIVVHAHIALAGENGQAMGGHLCVGTVVFAAECLLCELRGEPLKRVYDEITGLSLWK
ncbi:MAG: PPC domain-containing DNA-binding protein [PVC group bacterium]